MVHNDVEHNADAVAVCGVDHGLELRLGAEVRVGLGVVEHIVAVVGIVGKVVGVTRGDVAVDLLVGSGDPDGVHAEVVKIALVDFLRDSREVAAVEGAGIGLPAAEGLTVRVERTSVGMVVGGVSVVKTVGQEKVQIEIIPGEIVCTFDLAHPDSGVSGFRSACRRQRKRKHRHNHCKAKHDGDDFLLHFQNFLSFKNF